MTCKSYIFLIKIILIFLITNPNLSFGQTCAGSLGTPIVNIDFGSGTNNPGPQISQIVSGATTNYNFASYATGNPPVAVQDGDYALVNSVPVNSAWFTGATDHTGNPNGYMAFFNAAPTPGQFYRQTVSGLCPGTTYEFSAWVANVINPSALPGAILPNITFKILDATTSSVLALFNTGDINTNFSMTWKQYSFLFISPAGTNSVTLVLENNNVGGNAQPGNDLALDDITFRPCGPTITAAINKSAICNAEAATLTGSTSGGLNNPAYQWQISNNGGVNFNNIPGANTLNYTLSGLSAGSYQLQLVSAEAANINSPTCRFISNTIPLAVSNCTSNCSNWLATSSFQSGVTVGDVDVIGDKLTVEAEFMVSSAWGTAGSFGKLVSKHTGPADVNYSLMPITGEITTTQGYVNTPVTCLPEMNKVYHVAMVYDGSTLKFYRNGFLLSSVAWSGNLVNNNLLTTIANGSGFPSSTYQHFGYINEVRIWNIARTQAQIQAYMNTSLPSPSTQTGLLAYYIFNDLLNKQGNTAYNGSIVSPATINTTNPNCTFVADSCDKVTDSIIINDYTPVLSLDPCKNIITVENANAFKVGDTVLMIQMKGAVIDSSNSAAFGSITDYKSAGNYEFNYIKSKTGNNIELLNTITRTYEIPAGKVQLVRVPYYGDVTFNSVLTCLPWDGSKGGIVAFNSSGTVTLNADVDVSQRGFIGGLYEQLPSACDAIDYYYPQSSTSAALKGEGIVSLSNNMTRGRGKAANGGGSGNDHNSGGAGGSNAGAGGNGGKEFGSGFCAGIANGGIGGYPLNYSNASNKIFLGGGGGAGDINGVFGGFKGGNGGGIVIINTNSIIGNNNNIKSLGEDAADCTTNDCWESGSGGGAGGTILISSNSIVSNININTSGGKGGSLSNTNAAGYSAPGGGGGGGLLWVNTNTLSPAIIYTANGGNNGLFTALNETGGATNGSNGNSLTNLIVPVTTTLFKPNIDSVRFKYSIFNCSSFDFKGQAYININPINSWQWNFGNGATASLQNTSYSYSTDGTFTVKLVASDINGCKDSTVKNVQVQKLIIDAGNDTTICKNTAYQFNTTVTNGLSFNWSPSQFLNSSTIQNPIATVGASQKFYFTANNSIGCSATDSVTLSVLPDPVFTISPDQAICKNETIQLIASGGYTYQWKNESSLSSFNISNPSASPATTTTYAVKITDQCNISDSLFTTVTVTNLPVIGLTKSNDIDCSNDKAILSATGASEYIWSPVTGLDNPSSSNPVASPTTTTEYTVKGTDANGCSADGKITVEVTTNNKSGYNIPNAFTPNGDGKNDCIRVKYWGPTLEFEFNIYNRWGEKVFTSKNTDSCWDGTYKGIQQPSGVYVYYIKAKTTCGKVFKKGTVTLIR